MSRTWLVAPTTTIGSVGFASLIHVRNVRPDGPDCVMLRRVRRGEFPSLSQAVARLWENSRWLLKPKPDNKFEKRDDAPASSLTIKTVRPSMAQEVPHLRASGPPPKVLLPGTRSCGELKSSFYQNIVTERLRFVLRKPCPNQNCATGAR